MFGYAIFTVKASKPIREPDPIGDRRRDYWLLTDAERLAVDDVLAEQSVADVPVRSKEFLRRHHPGVVLSGVEL